MNAEFILKSKYPNEVFSSNKDLIKKKYRTLAKQWHPDTNKSPIANEVFNKLTLLYNRATTLTEEEIISNVKSLALKTLNGKNYKVKYKSKHMFELGEIYIADTVIAYSFEKKHKMYFDNAIKRINSLTFYDDTMKVEFQKYLPKLISSLETEDRYCLIIEKTEDLFLLKDLLKYYDGKIQPKHVAWILSSLYNLVCFFYYNGIAHNSITLDNYLVSPLYHGGVIAGGWWYSTRQDEKMLGVKKETFKILPSKTKKSKLTTIRTDLESIRLIGRQLLGNTSGTLLINDKDIPMPFCDWLRGLSSSNPFEEYEKWMNVLHESYGKRKFIEMTIDKNDFYQTITKEEM